MYGVKYRFSFYILILNGVNSKVAVNPLEKKVSYISNSETSPFPMVSTSIVGSRV